MRASLYIFILITLSGCIGTDFIDDPIVGEMVEIDNNKTSLLAGQTLQLHARYFDEYGIEEIGVAFNWISDDPSVTVDETGFVMAVSKGQANIYASHNGTVSPSYLLTIVGTVEDVANVQIIAPKTSLSVTESIQLSFVARNFNGEEVEPELPPVWTSSNPQVISVTDDGLITGHSNGTTEITCEIDGVKSSPILLSIGGQVRTGDFVENGYTAEGSAMLSFNNDGDLILSLSTDFKTSFALGTFIYLSNSTSGGVTRSSGLEIQEITTNGAKTFNITSIDSSIGINTYDYVIILCKPASITFGYAVLKP